MEQNWSTIVALISSQGITKAGVLNDVVDLCDVKNKDIVFIDTIFKEIVCLTESSHELAKVVFRRCTFEKGLRICGEIEYLYFDNCKFYHSLEQDKVLDFALEANYLGFKCGTFETNLHITQSTIYKLEIIDCKGQSNRINIYYCNITELIIKELKSGISLYNRNIADNNHCYISSLKLHVHPTFDSKIEIRDAKINVLDVTGTNLKGTILFNDLELHNEIKITNFFNNSTFILYTANLNAAIIHLEKSNFGKSEINNVNFAETKAVHITKCNLQDIQCTNVIWCDKVNPDVKHSRIYYKEKREIYRQLKLAMGKQMDNVNELKFFSLELNNYQRELWHQKGKIGDKIILLFGFVTNNFGVSWVLPAIWIFLLSALFFIYIKMLAGEYINDYLSNTNSATKAFYEYLYSINPVRKTDESYGFTTLSKIPEQIKVIDLFQRLITSLLFYQFISAFRKYTKK